MTVPKITTAQARALIGKKGRGRGKAHPAKKNKYGNVPVVVNGVRFDSKKEAERFVELSLLQRAGRISDLDRQVNVPLIGANGQQLRGEKGKPLVLRADFAYTEDGERVIEDVKSKPTKTKDYLLKKAILAAQGIDVREV